MICWWASPVSFSIIFRLRLDTDGLITNLAQHLCEELVVVVHHCHLMALHGLVLDATGVGVVGLNIRGVGVDPEAVFPQVSKVLMVDLHPTHYGWQGDEGGMRSTGGAQPSCQDRRSPLHEGYDL